MALADADIERYARQIVIPSCGVEGQLKLLAARVTVVGTGVGCERALTYLRAAGCRCRSLHGIRAPVHSPLQTDAPADLIVVVQATEHLATELGHLAQTQNVPIVWSHATDGGAISTGVSPKAQIEIYESPVPSYLAEVAGTCAAAAACALILNWADECGPWELKTKVTNA